MTRRQSYFAAFPMAIWGICTSTSLHRSGGCQMGTSAMFESLSTARIPDGTPLGLVQAGLPLGLGSAHVADTSDDWYTPRWIFEAAALTFDMDVAAPIAPERRACPARSYLTPVEDGLTHPWHGLIWCNPPYSAVRPWAEKFAGHAEGLLLVPGVRSFWVNQMLSAVDAVTLLGDVEFGRPDGSISTLRSVVILAAKGAASVDALHRVAAADVLHGAGTVFGKLARTALAAPEGQL